MSSKYDLLLIFLSTVSKVNYVVLAPDWPMSMNCDRFRTGLPESLVTPQPVVDFQVEIF